MSYILFASWLSILEQCSDMTQKNVVNTYIPPCLKHLQYISLQIWNFRSISWEGAGIGHCSYPLDNFILFHKLALSTHAQKTFTKSIFEFDEDFDIFSLRIKYSNEIYCYIKISYFCENNHKVDHVINYSHEAMQHQR